MVTPTFIRAVRWNPERERQARALRAATGGEIVWDVNRDAFDTYLRSKLAAGDDAAIFLEDDVELTRNWREKIERAIDGHPDALIQFYSNRIDDVRIGSRWATGSGFLNNQCYYTPPGMAAALAAWGADWLAAHPEDPTGYDLSMAHWMQREGLRYWIHVPSLVQHKRWRSEINPRRPAHLRQSRTFQP
jgi:hypothetical protein